MTIDPSSQFSYKKIYHDTDDRKQDWFLHPAQETNEYCGFMNDYIISRFFCSDYIKRRLYFNFYVEVITKQTSDNLVFIAKYKYEDIFKELKSNCINFNSIFSDYEHDSYECS